MAIHDLRFLPLIAASLLRLRLLLPHRRLPEDRAKDLLAPAMLSGELLSNIDDLSTEYDSGPRTEAFSGSVAPASGA